MLDQGDVFPCFEVDTLQYGRVDILKFLAGGYGAVLCFRGAWCQYCVGQLRAFTRSLDVLEAAGARVLALSAEDAATTATLAAKVGAPFPVGYGVDPHEF